MKKVVLLLTALLATVGGVKAAKQAHVAVTQVTSAAALSSGSQYVVRVNGGSYITESGTQYVAPSDQNAITAEAVFTFIADGDSWKVKNESTGNYWGALSSTDVATSFAPADEASAGSWQFTFNGNNVDAQSGGYHINRSSGVMHGWGTAINLQIYYEVENVEVVTEGLTDVSNDKAYYVATADRGAWYVPEGGTAITSTTKVGVPPSTSDLRQQFAFLSYNNNGIYHLYSISEKKFVSKSGSYTTLTDEVGDNVTLLATPNANYPFAVALQDGAYQMGISNGYNPAVITSYNSLTDAGNQARIIEVADFDPTEALAKLEAVYSTMVNVTYELYEEGGSTPVLTLSAVQEKNSEVAIPADMERPYSRTYYDFETENTIGSTDCTIAVTVRPKSGVVTDLANLSNRKAYSLQTVRGTLGTNGTQMVSTNGTSFEASTFAIVSYEDQLYLYSVADGKFVSHNTQPTLTLDISEVTPVTFSAETPKPYFFMGMGSNGVNVSNYATGIVVNSWTTRDDGNRYAIVEAADFDPAEALAVLDEYFYGNHYDMVEAEVLPFLWDDEGNPAPTIGKLFGLTADAVTDIVATFMEQLENKQFTQEEAEAIKAAKNAGIITPEDGKYYVIRNVSNGKYLNVKSANGIFADADAPVAGSVVKAIVRDGHIYFSTQDKEFGWCYGAANKALLDAAGGGKYAHFSFAVPGQVAFAHVLGNGEGSTYAAYIPDSYYTVNAENQVEGGVSTAAEAQWTFEEASSFQLHLNQLGSMSFATFSAPFGVTLSDAATAYTVSVSGNSAQPAVLGQKIPAGTPVLLVSETGATQVEATVDDTASAEVENNALQANYLEGAPAGYVLNALDNVVGFYALEGTLAANRAYLPKGEEGEVKGFSLLWNGTTGISTIGNRQNEAAAYNLAGQRVAKMQKGIYVVGGKKVAVR